MKEFLDYCKAALPGVLINIIGMFMVVFGIVLAYDHTISNVFLLVIVSLTLVYFGVPFLRRDIFKLSKKKTAYLHASYAIDYLNVKRGFEKQGPWDFTEELEDLKAIRDLIDNDVEAVKVENKEEN